MKSLAATYQDPSGNRCEALIIEHIDYVGRILSTMAFKARNEEQRENLHAAGLLGLVQAANKFQSNKGVPFTTFAYPRIRGAILDELRKMSLIPQQTLKLVSTLKEAYTQLKPPVTPEKLSQYTGLSPLQIEEGLEAIRFLSPESWSDFSTIVYRPTHSDNVTPLDEAERAEMKEILADSMLELPERERLVITLYYYESLNLAEIGAVLDLSESRISRILASARFRLKELVRCKTDVQTIGET